MIEPILKDNVANQDNPINCQEKIPRGEEVDDLLILKKRRQLPINKITCWELVAEVQMMVNVESICETKVTIDDDNVGEGCEQEWRDIWNDMNCFQLIQTAQTPSSAIEEEILVDQKVGTKLCLEGIRSIMFLGYDGA